MDNLYWPYVCIVFPSGAIAATIDINGDILYGNSWAIGWQFGGTGVYQTKAFITNDIGIENVDFELGATWGLFDDGFAVFSEGGWNGSIINPNYALATGSSNTINPFIWYTLFTGIPENQNFTLDYLFYLSGYGIYPIGQFGMELIGLSFLGLPFPNQPRFSYLAQV